MSGITLSAGVRQNLLALQDTASLASTTQNRLATGKKVNSALDNPGNFFTSLGLGNRAGDLNALLDSIGQAQQTLKAADTGLSSLSKLVESAKSIAKQAQQAPTAGSTTYNAISVTANPPNETLATHTGADIVAADSTLFSFTVNINGVGAQTVSFTSDANATIAEIQAGLIADFATKVNTAGFTAGTDLALTTTGNKLKIDALQADIDIVVGAGAANSGLTAATYNSTSLLDTIGTSGYTLGVAVNGGSTNQITFGAGLGQVSTLAELNTAIGNISGLAAGSLANNAAVTFNVASGSSQNSINLTSSNAALTAALGGITTGITQGVSVVGTPNATRTSLESDYNNVLTQIDALAGDASYNGVNLLKGDNLKVVFNERGTSSLTLSGVTYNAAGLGLTAISSGTFQNNTNIDTEIAKLDTSLTTLRTQASKFGSSLTTVQTRQDFTKNLINTLQSGADALVLADTNEEGANLLALQTRQQLSTTALSLSAQASNAVLRLFG